MRGSSKVWSNAQDLRWAASKYWSNMISCPLVGSGVQISAPTLSFYPLVTRQVWPDILYLIVIKRSCYALSEK